MTVKWLKVYVLCAAAAAAIAATASIASAHPMGNFTVNRYARLEPGASSLGLVYVVDYAEIPTFQELARVPSLAAIADPAALGRAPEARALEVELARAWVAGLNVSADGRRLELQLRASALAFVAGAGGLPTMRLRLQLDAPWPAGGEAMVRYDDTGAASRLGWREVVIRPGADVALLASTLPGTDRSQELTAYPADPNAQLPQETAVELRLSGLRAPIATGVAPPGQAEPIAPAARQQAAPPPVAAPVRGDRLADLITTDQLTPSLVLFSLLIAFALGALHALSPGHGKTIVAAYLVGSRGTARHALLLGAIVTVAHTAGVFLLGLVTLSLSAHVVPEKLYPVIQLLSGAAIAVLGIRMFARRLRDAWGAHGHDASGGHAHHHLDEHAHAHPHDHGPGHEHGHSHGHGHDHAHEHDHGHSHALPAGPLSLSSLVALGVSGGILPCPSALVVLLSAVALHRIAAGLVLIVAFSIGLASVLSLIGVLVVRAGTVLSRFESAAGIARRIPAVSALCVCLLGLGLAAGAVPDVQRVFF